MTLNKITIISIFILSLTCIAQKNKNSSQTKTGFQITLQTSNLKNQKIELYLITGITKKTYITDSISINENIQTVKINQPKKIINAIYYLRFKNQKNSIGLALENGADIKLKLSSTDVNEISCIENKINTDFLEYQKQEKNATQEQKFQLRNKLKNLYPNSILSLYLSVEAKITEITPKEFEEKLSYRNAYFDFIDKTDKRLLFLPNLTKLLYKYVTLLPITNENYIANIDQLMKGLDCKTKGYSLFANYFISNLNFFETYQLESAFNHLFKLYIDKNPCEAFSTSEYNQHFNKYITNLKIPLGSNTPDFEMISKDSVACKLSEVYSKNDFTFVAFYSPTCVHCQEKMPVVSASFINLKNKYPTKNIQLIAVINDTDESKWEQFIIEKKLDSWLNLKSSDTKRKYQEDFNTYSNPSFFLINKSGIVVLKTFNVKAIEEFIKN